MKKNKILLNILVCLTLFVIITLNVNGAQLPVDLGTAGDFVALSKTGISTTGTTSIVGDIGVSPISHTAITGFDLIGDPTTDTFLTSAIVTGNIYAADLQDPTPAMLTTAIGDMEAAYDDAKGRTSDGSPKDTTELGGGDITGRMIEPGHHKWGTDVWIHGGGVIISGNPNDIFILQISGNLLVASDAIVTLEGGAQAENIFWQVGGVTGAILGTNSDFKGIILAEKGVVIETGATLEGRALSQTAVTLDGNSVIESVLADPELVKINLESQEANLTVGQSMQLNATGFDQYDDEIDVAINYTSNNTAVATVSSNGLVSGISAGVVVINASSGNISNTSTITVQEPEVTLITLEPQEANLTVSNKVQLNATVYDQFGFVMDVGVVYNSSNVSIATVDVNGLITGISAGVVVINASSGNISNTSDILVEEPVFTSIKLDPLNITVNNTLELNATALDQFGFVIDDVIINYTSDNEVVANVTANGVVTAGDVGTANINASSGDVSTIILVTVFAPNLTRITLVSDATSIIVGNTLNLNARALDQFDYVMDADFTYSSSNTAVATVSSGGIVTGVAVGTAIVNASSGDVSATINITVIPRPTSGGGGGGSGSFPIFCPRESMTISEMPTGLTIVNFRTTCLPITSLEIMTNVNLTQVTVVVIPLVGRPAGTVPLQVEQVHSYLEVEQNNIANSDIEFVRILFKVDRNWVDNNGGVNNVGFYRYTNNWDLLDLRLISQDSTYYHFEANSPGFSYFAIGVVPTIIPSPPIIPPNVTDPVVVPPVIDNGPGLMDDNQTTVPITRDWFRILSSLWWIIVFLLLLLLLLILLIALATKSPNKKPVKPIIAVKKKNSPFGDIHPVMDMLVQFTIKHF